MKTVVFEDEVSVTRKGFTADPSGSRYCVIDYVNDEAGKAAALALARACLARQEAYASALFESIEGGEEQPILRTYEIETKVDVHPDARFIVLNYTRHYGSRVALQRYWLKSRDEDPDLAARIQDLLTGSEDDFASYVQSKLPKSKKGRRRNR